MDHGYIRIRDGGPSETEQKAALLAAGVGAKKRNTLHIDLAGAITLPARDAAIIGLKPGDRLVIHNLASLDTTAEAIFMQFTAIGKRGAVLVTGNDGKEYRLPIATAKIRQTHTLISTELKREARKAKLLAAGRSGLLRGAPQKLPPGRMRDRAEELWRDHTITADGVVSCIYQEFRYKISRRTLYSIFEARGRAIETHNKQQSQRAAAPTPRKRKGT